MTSIRDTSYQRIVSPISLRTSEYQINRGGVIASLAYETAKQQGRGRLLVRGRAMESGAPLLRHQHRQPDALALRLPLQSLLHAVGVRLQHHRLSTSTCRISSRSTTSWRFRQVSRLRRPPPTANSRTTFLANAGHGRSYIAPTGYREVCAGPAHLRQAISAPVRRELQAEEGNEIFGDVAYNVRSYVPGGYGYGTSPWGTKQAGFDALKSTTHPETSWTEEAGYRYTAKRASAQVSYFHVNFQNRLLAFSQGAGIAGNASILANAGGVTTNGVDGSVSIRITPEITLYNAATWNKSAYDSDTGASGTCIYAGSTGSCLPLKGMIVVDTPKVPLQDLPGVQEVRLLRSHRRGLYVRALLHLLQRQQRPRPLPHRPEPGLHARETGRVPGLQAPGQRL